MQMLLNIREQKRGLGWLRSVSLGNHQGCQGTRNLRAKNNKTGSIRGVLQNIMNEKRIPDSLGFVDMTSLVLQCAPQWNANLRSLAVDINSVPLWKIGPKHLG